jgi:phage terminase large subunit
VVGAWKKLKIIDRIELQLGWIQAGKYIVIDKCENHIAELESYSWTDDKSRPEDRNDHTINASQYAWIPYKNKIK